MDRLSTHQGLRSVFCAAPSVRFLANVGRLATMVIAATFAECRADDVLLVVDKPQGDRITMGWVDLTPAIKLCGVNAASWQAISAIGEDGAEVPFQFVPDADFSPQDRFAGLVIMRLPGNSSGEIKLRFAEVPSAQEGSWDGEVNTPYLVSRHDPKVQAGFPVEFQFSGVAKTVRVTHWADRVHDPQLGSFFLSSDPQAEVKRIADGPLCTVVRIHARYSPASGKEPPGRPSSIYDWIYFHDQPVVYVRSRSLQEETYTWSEHHFLELQFDQQILPKWCGGTPPREGIFGQSVTSFPCSDWGFVTDGQIAIGMFNAGQVLIYDAPGEKGNYIQSRGSEAWQAWHESALQKDAFLWFGKGEDLAGQIGVLAESIKRPTRLLATTTEIHHQRQMLKKRLASMEPDERRKCWWQAAVYDLEWQGRLNEALDLLKGNQPANWQTVTAGDLGMIVELVQGGARVAALRDISTGVTLASTEKAPLFELVLQRTDVDTSGADKTNEIRLRADGGWRHVEIKNQDPLTIVWNSPEALAGSALEVVATAIPQISHSAVEWTLSVRNLESPWTLRQAIFPQLAVHDIGPDAQLLYPQGCGIVASHPWSGDFSYRGRYPSGWTTMQFLAACRGDGKTGLYFGQHDPWGSTKEIAATSLSDDRLLQLRFEHWVPDMGKPGNEFELSGRAVWQLLKGDWYDAAQIYRQWVMNEAKWWPELGKNGREDSPQWMRELPLWALFGGTTGECAEQTQRFANFFGVPCGVHWYNWHMNPFDNDYPHYFPTKPEFPEGVQRLRAAGIHVMPYINGRLWDTRDKGMEDFEFTSRALPAASKTEQGEPYVETYGSKESDGSPVRLAVMCPTTELWQSKVKEIVLWLFQEYHVDAVYIDQIAAASPTLCMDKTHHHPLGGGHWWTEGYWKLLDEIRSNKPKDCMLTTECNGEPYVRWFDGYLTWHWQYDGQVPAFPAVYGGAIQMFGRSYGGGPTRDLALRMRAAQQLVFGEQLGWINPGVINEDENAAFLKRLAELRWQCREYFCAGRMLRPPRSESPLPRVRADWQWGGTRWVTTDSLLTGAWYIPGQQKILVLAINVSDELIITSLACDTSEVENAGTKWQVSPVSSEPAERSFIVEGTLRLSVQVPPRDMAVWEVTGAN